MAIDITGNTNSVQSFVRFVAFVVCTVLMGVVIVLPLSGLSTFLFETPVVFAIPSLIFVFWVSAIISGMFYILPEWENMVILSRDF